MQYTVYKLKKNTHLFFKHYQILTDMKIHLLVYHYLFYYYFDSVKLIC